MRHCAWKGLACCTLPASIRRLNLFAAACPFNGIGPYTAKAALILMTNTAGGFLTSPANQLGLAPWEQYDDLNDEEHLYRTPASTGG